jgi:hypothetical protein
MRRDETASRGTCPRADAISREVAGEAGRYWRSAARRLAREINVGWWLTAWLPAAFCLSAVGMVAVLYVRWRFPDAVPWVWAGIAASLVAAAVAAWWRSRSRFETDAMARVRLEDALGLKSRLSAASAGIGSWPARPARPQDSWPVVWRWQRPAVLMACTAVALLLAARVPIADAGAARKHMIEKPTDARIVESWMQELQKEKLVDERSAEEVDRKIAELMERPAETWYEHASLEAAGALKEQTQADLRELAGNLARAEQAAAALQSLAGSLPADVREALARDFAAAALAMQAGEFKPAGDLADLLRDLRPADLARLTPEQWRALQAKLAANRAALREALANCEGFDLGDIEGWCEECSGCKPCGTCECCKQGKACCTKCSTCGRMGKPGRGGISRGRADAELTFGERNELGTKRTEKISQQLDAERAAPDEVLAVVDGEHEVDTKAYRGPRAGGVVAGEGDGGAAVQVNSLLPKEQAVVRRFFE